MGRWAQARRRGGRGQRPSGLPAPPAPFVESSSEGLAVSRVGLPDPVGRFRLYSSGTGGDPWSFDSEKANEEPTLWQPAELELGTYYRATEVGGPPNYSGESLPSGTVFWEGA